MKGFRVGQRVIDSFYFITLGTGRVVKSLKTRVHVQYEDKKIVYDKSHARYFLKKV